MMKPNDMTGDVSLNQLLWGERVGIHSGFVLFPFFEIGVRFSSFSLASENTSALNMSSNRF